MVFASHTVQVISDAIASPTMTACTTISAFTNMPHGDRLRGSSALSVAAKPAPGSEAAPNAIRAAPFRIRPVWVSIVVGCMGLLRE